MMTVPYERITLTAYSNNEWLRENFSKEIESFNQVQNLIQEESNDLG